MIQPLEAGVGAPGPRRPGAAGRRPGTITIMILIVMNIMMLIVMNTILVIVILSIIVITKYCC